MSILIQSQSTQVVLFLENLSGQPAIAVPASSVQVDLKKSTAPFFSNKAITDPVPSSADIGSGSDGTVTLSVPGLAGDSYTVEVAVPGGTSSLNVVKTGTVILVNLAVSLGVPVASANTATLVAQAINSLASEVSAVASGTGLTALSVAEGPTALTGGLDGTWTHTGGGFYLLDLTASDTDTLGSLAVRVRGTNVRGSVESYTVTAAIAQPPTPGITVPLTTVYGYVRNPDGSAAVNSPVTVRILSQPTVLQSSNEGMVITNRLVTTKTDSSGFFFLSLVTGSVVDVFVPGANYRRTLTVPSSSSNIFDIP